MKVVSELDAKFINKVTILLFIVTSALAMSCKYVEKIFPQITPEEVEEVKNICSNLKPPFSFIKTKEVDTVKSHAATRSIQYSAPDSPDEVKKYFVNLLTHSGWRYQKEDQLHSDRLLLKKGEFAVNIDSPHFSFTLNRVYFVECSIGLW